MNQMSKERIHYVNVGRLGRSVGKAGEMRASIDAGFRKAFDNVKHVFVNLEGQKVPYFIDYYYDGDDFIFKFDDIHRPEEAAHLVNTTLSLSLDQIEAMALDKIEIATSFEDFTVLNENNTSLGVISRIEEYPHQIMAFVKLANGIEKMLPLVEDWILDVDMRKKTITMNIPTGLLSDEEE